MRKREVNSDQIAARVDDSQRVSDIFAGDDAAAFDSLTDESECTRQQPPLSFLEERIAFTMPSEYSHLDGVLEYLNDRMLQLGIVEPEDSEVMIALDEAIVNAIKHGNKCDPRKAVHIVAEFSIEGARFMIADEGPGFARESVPDPTEPCRLLEPSGRGLLLINHIMDEVRFNQIGNCLEMFKRPANKAQSEIRSADGEIAID